MIHVFDCAQKACTLPGRACLACADACAGIEELACRPLQQCVCATDRLFKAMGDYCANFLERPLSTDVLIKVALSLAGLRACAHALAAPGLGECEASGGIGIKPWLAVQMGFACLSLLFAPYLQSRVWELVLQESLAIEPSIKGVVRVPAREVYESFRIVLLHDVPVCLYSAALLLSFAWSSLGLTLVTGASCNPEGWPKEACDLGLLFFWLTLVYMACWYFCGCCGGGVELRRAPADAVPTISIYPPGDVPVPCDVHVPCAPPIDDLPPHEIMSAQAVRMASPAEAPRVGLAAAPDQPGSRAVPRALACLCSFVVPPLGVFARFGFSKQLILCLCLTIMGYIPGMIYACYVIGCEDASGAWARESRDEERVGGYILIE